MLDLEKVEEKIMTDLAKDFTSASSDHRFVLLQPAARYTASQLLQAPEHLANTLGEIRFGTIFLHGYNSIEAP